MSDPDPERAIRAAIENSPEREFQKFLSECDFSPEGARKLQQEMAQREALDKCARLEELDALPLPPLWADKRVPLNIRTLLCS